MLIYGIQLYILTAEADIYEFVDLALQDPNGPKVLFRARHDRLLAKGQGHLWDYVQAQPISGIQQVQVPSAIGGSQSTDRPIGNSFCQGDVETARLQERTETVDNLGGSGSGKQPTKPTVTN